MASLAEKTRRSTLFVVPGQMLIKVFGLLYVVILARGLSVEDYGIYNFLIGSILVFSFFCNFGLGSSLQRFLPEYSQLNQGKRIVQTILFSHLFRIVLSVVVFLVAIAWFNVWSDEFGLSDKYFEFVIFAIGTFFLYQIEFFQIEFNALFLHGASTIGQVFYTFIKLVLAYFVFKLGFQLTGVLAVEAVSYCAGALLFVYIYLTRIRHNYVNQDVENQNNIEFKRIGKYSGINALVIPGGILYSHSMDYFVVAVMANPYQLGLYALASRASKMLLSIMPQNILQGVIRPAFYHRYYSVEDKNAELNVLFQTLIKLNAAFLFPTLLLVAIAAGPLLTVLFGEKYIEASNVFLLFLVFNFFVILEVPSDLVLQAIEKVQARLYAQIFAIYNVLAAIVLMQYYGIAGVAFATGSALMLKSFFYYYMARRYTGISLCWGALARIILNTIAAGSVTLYLMTISESKVFLFASLVAGLVVYILMSFINNFLDNNEKQLINKLSKRKLFNV